MGSSGGEFRKYVQRGLMAGDLRTHPTLPSKILNSGHRFCQMLGLWVLQLGPGLLRFTVYKLEAGLRARCDTCGGSKRTIFPILTLDPTAVTLNP